MKIAHFFRSTLHLLIVALVAGCAWQTQQHTGHVTEYLTQDGKSGLTGNVYVSDTSNPLAGAYVNVYPDTLSNLLGPSQFISSPTDEQGRYTIENVPPGTYYIVARKRQSGQPTGPLAPGDYYSQNERITAEVRADKLARVDIPVIPMKAPMFFKKAVTDQRTDTGIRGRLVDPQGQPVPGSFAIAYMDDNIKRAPDFASTLTDQQGRFVLYLPDGGEYYLAGRVHAWDMPRPGEPYGIYGSAEPEPLKVEKGSFVEEVEILMTPFSGEYKPGKSRRPAIGSGQEK